MSKPTTHRWIVSGRPARMFGMVSPLSFVLLVLAMFSRNFLYLAIITLSIDALERYARMPPREVGRRLLIFIGTRLTYRRSRELGSSYRSRLWTYHFGHHIGDGLFFGIFHPVTVLSLMGSLFFYAAAWFFGGYGVSATIAIKGFCQGMFGLFLIILIFSLLRDCWYVANSSSKS